MDGATFPPSVPIPSPRAGGARWETVQHLYTVDPLKPPPDNFLLVGELALGLADPMQVWVGVPTDMDPTGTKLLFDNASYGYVLPAASTTVRGGVRVDGTTTIMVGDVISAVGSGTGAASIVVSDTPPPITKNTLWWDSVGTQLYLAYDDGTSLQWVLANNPPGTGGGGGGASLITSDTPPPLTKNTLWFDSMSTQLFVAYDDGTGPVQWVQANGGAAPSGGPTFPEAPGDGKIYGRRGSVPDWEPVIAQDGGLFDGGNF